MRTVLVQLAALGTAAVLVMSGCGAAGGPESVRKGASVVVTTSILGDVVRNLVGDAVDGEVVMPPGSDPHHFAPSARQAASMRDADVLVVNGRGFEAALVDTIDAAAHDGAVLITAADGIGPEPDPHFFTDPVLMRAAAEHIADELAAQVDGLDTAAYRTRVDTYLTALDDLDRDVVGILAAVPAERRTLVTNHEVFASFADRYDFEVLGTVIPAASTLAEPSAARLRQLADDIARTGVPAIFAETSAPTRLAKALAAEGAGVEVVELYSESLGAAGSDGATYLAMVRTNAERIAAALG